MTKKTIWISFDLGVRGNYEGMYEWLDSNNARACVGELAVLKYEFEGDLVKAIRNDLQEVVGQSKNTRVYIIFREEEDSKKMKGRFVIGNRRAPPWAGYAEIEGEDDSDEF